MLPSRTAGAGAQLVVCVIIYLRYLLGGALIKENRKSIITAHYCPFRDRGKALTFRH